MLMLVLGAAGPKSRNNFLDDGNDPRPGPRRFLHGRYVICETRLLHCYLLGVSTGQPIGDK